jgi:hypothetical protein
VIFEGYQACVVNPGDSGIRPTHEEGEPVGIIVQLWEKCLRTVTVNTCRLDGGKGLSHTLHPDRYDAGFLDADPVAEAAIEIVIAWLEGLRVLLEVGI